MGELIKLLREYNCTRGTQARAADQIEQLQARLKEADYLIEEMRGHEGAEGFSHYLTLRLNDYEQEEKDDE